MTTRTPDIIRHLYPAAQIERDFSCAIEAGASVITYWNLALGTQPTTQELADAELPAMKAKAVAAIKIEANRRILSAMPDWKQRNLIARSVELTRRESKGTATPAEIAELDTLEAAKAGVDAVRSASDSMEAEVATLTTVADCDAYIAGIQADTASAPRTVEWP